MYNLPESKPNDLESGADKCQTGTAQVSNADSKNTDRIPARFAAMSFFLVTVGLYSRTFCTFLGMATVNIFSTVNEMILISQKIMKIHPYLSADRQTELGIPQPRSHRPL